MGLLRRPKELDIFRHALSQRNSAKQTTFFADEYARKGIAGIPDHEIPLAEPAGPVQCTQTGVYLAGHPLEYPIPDAIYFSDYRRTRQTMDGVLAAYPPEVRAHIQIYPDVSLRERDSGYAYDMTEAEARKHFPYLQGYWKTFGPFFARPPGGESFADMAERLTAFWKLVCDRHPNQVVWFFCHGGPVRLFRYILEGWSFRDVVNWQYESPDNCGITKYRFDARTGEPLLAHYNRTHWKLEAAKPSRKRTTRKKLLRRA